MLEVRLLGAFELRSEGRTVSIPSRAAQALLAFLILNEGSPHRRELLAGMLWPDSSEARARASLRHELWRIRKALASTQAQGALLADELSVAFAPAGGYRLDVRELTRLADDSSIEDLTTGLSAYRGELLPGFYEDWIVAQREQHQLVFERRLSQLVRRLESDKRWTELVDWAERWLASAQEPEAAYRALMVAYAGLGDRVKVLSTYERCAQALAQLGLEPSDEIQSLAEVRGQTTNLPAPLTSFIGRRRELKELTDLVLTTRFVTLTGTGGVGKTRLAMELAHQMRKSFPDGVWCLELAGNDDPDLVPSMLLSRLRTPAVSNGGDRSVTNALTRHLCHRHALIVLDNCEHLIAACAQLVESLVTSCQDLHIVTTSREPLRVSGETCYFVPSLETPPAGDVELPAFAVAELDSVRLFVERAKSRMPGFGLTAENARHVGNLCRRLDGIPLAIELAAGRVSSLTPESLVEHLDQRFALLTGGSPTALPRHRTLRAMIDWSYDLLLDAERVLLGRLSVFAGDWTLEAVQHIAAFGPLRAEQVLGLLPGLVEKSLVMLDPATSRYHLLETVRAYGLERLRNGGEEADCRARHVGYYLHFVESCDFVSSEDFATAARLFKEQDDFLAAISWCEHMQSGAQLALRFLEATGLYWMILGQSDVGYRLARRALAIPGAEIRTRARGRALLTLANMGYFQGRGPEVRTAAKESVSIAREVGDERGEATALNCLARILDQLGEHEKALELFGDALRLARRLHLNAEASKIENDMADTLRCMGDFESARALYKQSLETASRAQRTTFAVVVRCINLSTVAIQLRDVPAARKWLRQGVDAASESTVPFPWWFVLNAAVGLASATEEWSVAAHFYGAAEADRERHGGDAVDPADARFLEPLIARAREQLGEIAYKHSYEAGCALPNADAVGELRTWLESTETRVA